MFEIHLSKYQNKGQFSFDFSKDYKVACNAPKDLSGVYLICKVCNGAETLLYIGSSGQRKKDGLIKHRKGGMRDRLVNGYHPNRFGQEKRLKRHVAIPKQMTAEGISEIRVYWWVTYDEVHKDFPTDVESLLVTKYRTKPAWHKS